tara:strand:- start:128 stop:313 length:186 start_codon:yes stop_codon:yes gene_type:complete
MVEDDRIRDKGQGTGEKGPGALDVATCGGVVLHMGVQHSTTRWLLVYLTKMTRWKETNCHI